MIVPTSSLYPRIILLLAILITILVLLWIDRAWQPCCQSAQESAESQPNKKTHAKSLRTLKKKRKKINEEKASLERAFLGYDDQVNPS